MAEATTGPAPALPSSATPAPAKPDPSRTWRGRIVTPALRALRRMPLVGPPLVRATLVHRYRKATGLTPRLDPPGTFNERILHRMLYDHDPYLRVVNDKLAMREVVARRAGPEFLVPLLGVWDHPNDVPWDSLPERFVLKPNHASGRVALVRGPAERDPAALAAKARAWLATDYFDTSLEWGYRGLPRRLLAEPLLAGPRGGPLVELQVLTFGGRAEFYRFQVGEKGTGRRTDAWYGRDGTRLDLRIGMPSCEVVAGREAVARALAAAERVSERLVQLRVDFYITPDGLRIGELTPYHRAGVTRWQPPEWDARLGAIWAAAETRSVPDGR